MLCMGFNPGATGWQAQTDLLSQGGRSFVFFLCISFYLSRLLNILPAGSALNSFRFLYDSSHPQVMYQNVCVRERERAVAFTSRFDSISSRYYNLCYTFLHSYLPFHLSSYLYLFLTHFSISFYLYIYSHLISLNLFLSILLPFSIYFFLSFKKWAIPGRFLFIFVFSNKHFHSYNK